MPAGTDQASRTEAPYAQRLLDACAAGRLALDAMPTAAPSRLWAECGAMSLTGHADGPPRFATGALAHCAREAMRALRALAPEGTRPSDIDAAALLAERAAIAGTRRRGATAPGGACRLLRTADGYIALNLPRPSDRELLPAWLEVEVDIREALEGEGVWQHVAHWIRGRATQPLLERGREMGMALASTCEPAHHADTWMHATRHAPASGGPPRRRNAPRVVDLSSLWAGPLCAQLLGRAGADVVKVESSNRPDGARRGPAAFFDAMNEGKRSVALDLRDAADLHTLRALIARADIVIESARPRALAQLGVHAERILAETPGLTWVGITGHGREAPQRDWVAFGDDAAIAGGVRAEAPKDARGAAAHAPIFVGDAIADPLTGLHAAVAALAAHRAGGGQLIDIALARVARHAHAEPVDTAPRSVEANADAAQGFVARIDGEEIEIASPRARSCVGHAASLGADNAQVLREWGVGG